MGAYDDIINLPHPVSAKHPRMPLIDRAAQFSPFQALTGYGEAIQETARLTEQKMALTDEEKIILDEKLRFVYDAGYEAVFTYFEQDRKKNGGAYIDAVGTVKKIDCLEQCVILTGGIIIPIDDIVDIEAVDHEEP